jgi:hypothetical protein
MGQGSIFLACAEVVAWPNLVNQSENTKKEKPIDEPIYRPVEPIHMPLP